VPFAFSGLAKWLPEINGERGVIWRYGIAVASVLIATAVRFAFNPVLGAEAPLVPFGLAVIVAARMGGRGPGLAATVLSSLSANWFFIEPLNSLGVGTQEEVWGLSLFVIEGALIALLVGSLRELLLLRTRTEEALRASQARLEFVLEAARLGAWDLDLATHRAWRSPQHDAIFGYSVLPPEWTYEMFLDHVLPEDREDVDGKVRQAVASRSDLQFECRIRRADGTAGWIRAQGRSQLDPQGRPLRLSGIMRDVTADKTLEEALRQSEQQFRTLANAMPQLGGMANSDGWFFWLNQRWYDYTGLSRERSEGWGWLSALEPEASHSALERWQHSIGAGEPFEGELAIRGADDVTRPFLARAIPVRDRDGRVTRWLATMTDISEQRQTEDALRKAHSEERARATELQAIMDAVPVAMFVSRDPECRAIIGNHSAYKMLREPPGSNLSGAAQEGEKPAFRVLKGGKELPPDELPLRQAAACGKAIYDLELELAFEDGNRTYIIGNAVPFLDAEGRPSGAVGAFVDITERKRNEERLRQAQKMESIGLLAGGVAHDFNNLLTVIIGHADSALHRYPSSEGLQQIMSASQRAAQLTRQLLAYAGRGQFVTSTFNLGELVSRCKPLLSASIPKRVDLVFRLSDEELLLKADPSQVEQILMNLVINAAEAIPPRADGRIEIVTGSSEVTTEKAREQAAFDAKPGRFVRLEVTDNGSGMDQATQAQIFDPFFSTKFTGRGLGLAAVQGIVRSCEGFIDVRSAPGAGSRFRVFLPAAGNQPAAETPVASRPSVAEGQDGRQAAILVVDDEKMLRELVCEALRSRGYEVLEARNGKEALDVLARASALPSVALIDLAMPLMGGEELVPILNRDYPKLRIIMTRGYSEEDAGKGLSSGTVYGFLQKPYTVATLTQKVEEIFNREARNEDAPNAA